MSTYKAQVKQIFTTDKDGVTPLTKKGADGSERPIQLCIVEFTDGPLKGKSEWATRTLINRDGVEKSPVKKDQEVIIHANMEDGKVFLTIASGEVNNATNDELAAAFGFVTVAETVSLEEGM
jgi:hypothetical protein